MGPAICNGIGLVTTNAMFLNGTDPSLKFALVLITIAIVFAYLRAKCLKIRN